MKPLKPLKLLFVFFAVLLISQTLSSLTAQEAQKLSLEKGTIANRFDYVIKESGTYNDSRVVKAWWLTRLKSHVSDSLRGLKNQLHSSEKIIATKDAEIDSLRTALAEVQNALLISKNEKNSIRFLGIAMSKQAYNSIVWLIIFGLGTFLLIFIILFKRSNLITKQTKTSYAELSEEYDSHKKRALEREQTLVNNFHREVTKLKEKKTV